MLNAEAIFGSDSVSAQKKKDVQAKFDACFVVHRYLRGSQTDDEHNTKAHALAAFAQWWHEETGRRLLYWIDVCSVLPGLNRSRFPDLLKRAAKAATMTLTYEVPDMDSRRWCCVDRSKSTVRLFEAGRARLVGAAREDD